jgi:HD-GYP domain-containing protein (c-di-GMP phosphodiesterase class II)
MRVSSPGSATVSEDELPTRAENRHGEGSESAALAGSGHVRLWRYLPLVLLVTAALTALPVVIATTVLPRNGDLLSVVASAALAIAIAMIIANLAAAVWMRRQASRDVLFSELILWGWARRCWTEWRLRHARAEYESVAKSSPHAIELLERVTRLLQARDPYAHRHSQRVARHAVRIARAMRLPATEVAKIRTAAAIHDVGKLYTPREILNNPNRLSDKEFEIVKRHAADGADMVGPAGDGAITAMVRHHHERLSGNGYPDGLAGEQIPLGARIIAVADTFDAITSTRPYRQATSHKSALDVLAHESGTQLDAAAVAAFRQSYSGRRTVAWTALASALPQRALAWLQASGAGVGLNSLPQVLPVVGAAGALALAHGHGQHQATARARARPATRAPLATSSTGAPLRAARVRAKRLGVRAPVSAPKPGGQAPRSTAPRISAPKHASGGGGSHESNTPASTSPPRAPASEPTATTTTPPQPEKTIPAVPTPTVSIPTAPIPPVNVPEVGGVKVPSAGVSVNVGGVEVGL